MTTSSLFSGILIVFLQLGQGPDLPANFSLTENRLWQFWQVTLIVDILTQFPEQWRRWGAKPSAYDKPIQTE